MNQLFPAASLIYALLCTVPAAMKLQPPGHLTQLISAITGNSPKL